MADVASSTNHGGWAERVVWRVNYGLQWIAPDPLECELCHVSAGLRNLRRGSLQKDEQFAGCGASIRRSAPAGMSWTAVVLAGTVPSLRMRCT
jgi:hypothetical protein